MSPLLHPLYSRVNNEAEVKNKMIAELGKFALKNGLEKFEIPKKIHLDAGKKFIPRNNAFWSTAVVGEAYSVNSVSFSLPHRWAKRRYSTVDNE